MKSIKYGHCFLAFVLGISTSLTLLVVFDLTSLAPKVLERYEIIMKPPPLEPARAEFDEEFGYWANSRRTLYTYFVVPPFIGFAIAIALRRYVRKLLLRNQQLLSRNMHKPLLQWDGVGVKELRDEVSTLPESASFLRQLLPLGGFVIILFWLESIVFSGHSTLAMTFLATCGFTSYPTWKRMFVDSTSPRQIN